MSDSQPREVHSDSILELGYLAGSTLHMRDSLAAAGSSHQMAILSCMRTPDAYPQRGRRRQLVVAAAFSAG